MLGVVAIVIAVISFEDAKRSFRATGLLVQDFRSEMQASVEAVSTLTDRYGLTADSSLAEVQRYTRGFRSEALALLHRLEMVTLALPDTLLTVMDNYPDQYPIRAKLLGSDLHGEVGFDAMNNPAAYLNRGVAKSNAGDQAGAIRDLNTAIALYEKPERKALGHYNISHAYEMENLLDLSLHEAELAVELDSTVPLFEQRRAAVLGELGRHEEACAALDRALATSRTKQDSLGALRNRSIARRQAHRVKDALVDIEKAIQLDPEDASLRYNKAIVLSTGDNKEAALGAVKAALELNPNYWQAHSLAATLKSEIGDAPGAVAVLREALRVSDPSAELHFRLGNALLTLDQREEARRQYLQAVQIDSTHVRAHANLGLLAARQGHAGEALREYEAAIRHSEDPSSGLAADIQRRVSIIRTLLGRP